MAKRRDRVWYLDEHGVKVPAFVTRAQTTVNGLPAADSYDADTVDLSLHVEHEDEGGTKHSTITGGVVGAKIAKTEADQKVPGHWWPC